MPSTWNLPGCAPGLATALAGTRARGGTTVTRRPWILTASCTWTSYCWHRWPLPSSSRAPRARSGRAKQRQAGKRSRARRGTRSAGSSTIGCRSMCRSGMRTAATRTGFVLPPMEVRSVWVDRRWLPRRRRIPLLLRPALQVGVQVRVLRLLRASRNPQAAGEPERRAGQGDHTSDVFQHARGGGDR